MLRQKPAVRRADCDAAAIGASGRRPKAAAIRELPGSGRRFVHMLMFVSC
jgi:hypothetical protein